MSKSLSSGPLRLPEPVVPVTPALNVVTPSNGIGTIWADFSTSPGAGTSSATKITDLSEQSPDFDAPATVIKLPYAASNAAIYDYVPAAPLSLVDARTLGVWLRAPARVDGAPYSGLKILFCESSANFTTFGQCVITLRADGKWRFYVFNPADTSVGAGSWTVATQVARIRFREIDSGSSTNRPRMSSGDAIYIGAIRTNPKQRAIAMVRFDDNYLAQITAAAIGGAFVGNSGVTIADGSYSFRELVSAFGFAATSYILTDLVGASGFMSVSDLRTLQDTYGWDIAFQTKANPCSYANAGLRMLGPLGYALVPLNTVTNVNTTTGVLTTSMTDHLIGGSATGQPFPLEFFGSNLPGGVTAGVKYYAYRINATTFTIHTSAAGSWDGATDKLIPTTAGTYANFGARYWGSANDSSAILADFQDGTDWMQAQGFNAYRHFALNQGAWDTYTEEAFIDFGGFDTAWTISLGNAASMPVFDSAENLAVGTLANGYMNRGCLYASWMNICSAYGTDSTQSESTTRAYVRTLVRNGWVGGNFHHVQTMSANKNLLWFLDECKVWSDKGMLDVLTVSQAWERIAAARELLRLPASV